MSFNKNKCIIRKLYCGNGKIPKDTSDKKYSRKGSSYECLKKGFGIADWNHRKKNLSKTSLQQIPYIGPVYENNFKKNKIYSLTSLISKLKNLNLINKKEIITKCCTKSNGGIDQKAINSILLYLHSHGVKNLPSCKIVNE